VVISGRIEPPDLPGLCERVAEALQQSASRIVVCDVRALTPAPFVSSMLGSPAWWCTNVGQPSHRQHRQEIVA
jgi:hypothetical protein